jgi:hypothetical protein
MKEASHSDNVYARRITDGEVIHISVVERKDTGRGPGYYCLGCDRRLQAVLTVIDNRMNFFRHDAEAVKGKPKCTYSDETYRHKLAKDLLQLAKRIKVPNLYKYSLDKENPRKYLIKESHYVEAAVVLNEHYIYENEAGEIACSRNKEIETTKSLFMKPDVLFLDSDGKPILIIELVATNKPNKEKLIKLKRLGIDAVQVRIPKESPQAIELAFKHTDNTFWLYNYEEDNARDIPFSNTHSEGISQLDINQRAFFEENYFCRSTQIGNLIRQINRLLESKHYKETISGFRSEIQRVEENTASHRGRLDGLRGKFSERGIEQHSERREKLTEKQREFQVYSRDLERRYYAKARELELEESLLEQGIAEIELQGKELNSRGTSARKSIEEEEDAIDRIRRQSEELPGIYRDIQADFERRTEQATIEAESVEGLSRRVQSAIESEPKTLGPKENELEREIEAESGRIEAESGRIEAEISKVDREIKQLESKARTIEGTFSRQYPTNREEYIRRIEDGSYQRSKWFNTEHAKLREFTDAIEVYRTLNEELTILETKNRN